MLQMSDTPVVQSAGHPESLASHSRITPHPPTTSQTLRITLNRAEQTNPPVKQVTGLFAGTQLIESYSCTMLHFDHTSKPKLKT